MSVEPTPLAGQLLIALPALVDPNFARTAVLVCQHDGDGAMGLVVNRAAEYTLGDVLGQMGIECREDALGAHPVLAGGPVVRELSAGFDRYWNDALAYPADALITPGQLANIRDTTQPSADETAAQATHALPPALNLADLALHWAPAQALTDNPIKLVPGRSPGAGSDAEDAVLKGVLSLLHAAQHDVLIVTPYFVPGPEMMATFAALRARGIPVRIVTNSLSSTTALLAQVGYARHRKALLRLGIDLREMHAAERARLRQTLLGSAIHGELASLHAKLVVVDGRVTVVGSMNMDFRSRLYNTEVALIIRSEPLSAQATRQIQAVIDAAAWKLELAADGTLRWRAPPGADFSDARYEPDTGFWLRLLATLLQQQSPGISNN